MAKTIYLLVATIQLVSAACRELEFDDVDIVFPTKLQPPGGWFPLFAQEIPIAKLKPGAVNIMLSKPADFKGSQRYCYTANMKNFGNVVGRCVYDDATFQKEYCQLNREGPPVPDLPQQMYARGNIIASDNSTYFIMVKCVNEGSAETYVVFSSKPTVNASKKAEISARLKKAGFTLNEEQGMEDPVKVDMGCKNTKPRDAFFNQPLNGIKAIRR